MMTPQCPTYRHNRVSIPAQRPNSTSTFSQMKTLDHRVTRSTASHTHGIRRTRIIPELMHSTVRASMFLHIEKQRFRKDGHCVNPCFNPVVFPRIPHTKQLCCLMLISSRWLKSEAFFFDTAIRLDAALRSSVGLLVACLMSTMSTSLGFLGCCCNLMLQQLSHLPQFASDTSSCESSIWLSNTRRQFEAFFI